jgi:hypothetical protein
VSDIRNWASSIYHHAKKDTKMNEDQQAAIRNAWLDMTAHITNYDKTAPFKTIVGTHIVSEYEVYAAMKDSIEDLEREFPFLLNKD